MTFDLVVIGSGPGGQKAALQAAKAGKKVLVVERDEAVGGGCLHNGTIPSKSFRESVYRWSMGSRGTLGQEIDGKARASKKLKATDLPDMQRLVRRKDRVVSTEAQVIFDQFKRNKVSLYHGSARILSPHEVEIHGRRGRKRVRAAVIVIAVGGRPAAPEGVSVDGKRIFDSNSILTLKKTPQSLVVLGGGIIGCEYASMFSMAGTRVHLVDKRKEILGSIDREIVTQLTTWFEHQGMELHLGSDMVELVKTAKGVRATLQNGRKIEAEACFIAQGRCGNTEDLGLRELGIEPDARGLLKVDAHFRTKIPNIYAVGDVVGYPALASTSMEQGRIASCHAFDLRGMTSTEMPEFYPYGIYTIPEISTIGETEEQLAARGAKFVVGRGRYREVARGQIVGDRWGLLKICVDRDTCKILGCHIIGDSAAELIHIAQAVMTFGGDLNYFIGSVFNYPTLAEAYKTAAFDAANQREKAQRTSTF